VVRASIEAWLPEPLGGRDLRVTGLTTPETSGASAQTFIFRCAWMVDGIEQEDAFVARVVPADPDRGGRFMDYDLALEAALTRAAGTVVPTAEIVAVGPENLEVFGNPFLLTRFVSGRVVSDQPPLTAPESWSWKLGEGQQAKMADGCLKALTAVQSLDLARVAIPGVRPAMDAPNKIAALIDYWERFYYWGKRPGDDRPHEVWDATLTHLRANIPHDEPTVLNWGDSKVGNMIFDENLDVIAVLDWEMACLGSPEIDLSWFLFHCAGQPRDPVCRSCLVSRRRPRRWCALRSSRVTPSGISTSMSCSPACGWSPLAFVTRCCWRTRALPLRGLTSPGTTQG
jgi:aminoglycoside phosphotransferase (APT) family kinase protein